MVASETAVLQQCQNKVSFQRRGSSVVVKFFAESFNELALLCIHKRELSTFQRME